MAEPSQSWNRQAYTLKVKMQSVSDDAVRKRLLEKFATSPSTVSYSETCLRDFGHKSEFTIESRKWRSVAVVWSAIRANPVAVPLASLRVKGAVAPNRPWT